MQTLYFMGLGGTAMGNAALLLSRAGYRVCGADGALYPPMSTLLEEAGIACFQGYDAQRLAELKPDLVVVGNIISRGNPEIEWLLNTRAFPYVSLPELLNQKLLQGRKTIVVTGTHGKTTTSTLSAYLLEKNGLNPGYFIGGVPNDFPSGAAIGSKDAPFVIEGDEYDTAFFDKRSKFIHYTPWIGVINNIEFDHADIFRDLADVQRTFRHFSRLVPNQGYILINGEDRATQALLPMDWTQILRVGIGPDNDLQIRQFYESPKGFSSFELVYKGQYWAKVEWPLQGLFNARNAAMAALASALACFEEDPTKLDLRALSSFKGVKRRQERIYESERCILIEDFGHHPSALEQTLRSMKMRYPSHSISVCFEPSSNTSQSCVFQEEFTQALSLAPHVLVAPPPKKHSGSASSLLDAQRLVEALRALDLLAHSFASPRHLLESLKTYLLEHTTRPHVVCFFSNGAFGGITKALKEELAGLQGS